ncbi:hypothetical protein PS3A_05800 [Pseudomonas sp. 3A(2025)]
MPTCRYHYDALDRLAARTDAAQDSTRHFYQASRLATAIGHSLKRTILATDRQLLAQKDVSTTGERSHLLATDQQDSVLTAASAGQRSDIVYSPYGHRQDSGVLPGFTGQESDPLTGHYLLGNGYRGYNPVLRRFNSPDSLSPFGEGGLNAYMYCRGDPVNRSDPSGHFDISGDFWRDVMPILGMVVPFITVGFMYKSIKLRLRRFFAGEATKSDNYSIAGVAGAAASAVVGIAGVAARYAEPESNIGFVLGSLALVGTGAFTGVRYQGYKFGKVKPAVGRHVDGFRPATSPPPSLRSRSPQATWHRKLAQRETVQTMEQEALMARKQAALAPWLEALAQLQPARIHPVDLRILGKAQKATNKRMKEIRDF